MKLLPRSLLWRTVLLIALLLIAAHLAWGIIFRITERAPMAHRFASQIASVINLTRSALIAANPDKRLDLLRAMAQQEGIQIYPALDNETVAPLPPPPPGMESLDSELRDRLGADTELAGVVNGIPGLWVSFDIDRQKYWLRMPRERMPRNNELRWISWGVLVLVLSLLGAFLLVARINRPLRELTRAAALVGRGRVPQPVAETGPSEISTMARAFNQMTSDLQRIEADRALLLAGVSHDLRTPLARIRLGIEMSDAKMDPTLKSGMVQDIEDIDAVINQFLDFARVTGEDNVLTDSDLNELVHAVLDRYQRQGKAVTARLGELPRLPLKPLAMQRLLTNLIDNALRHGGAPVEVETALDGGKVRLSVFDRGPGIPETETERMLQPFTRLDAARSTSGSGLGLAIVDRIAQLHHGSVRLLARDGGGLEARVELPV
ncbi:MAG TPA: ATP-binding protein [Burkholderiales bacterium]|nr:ATP-binding protein [Burkholderiales bacterium]